MLADVIRAHAAGAYAHPRCKWFALLSDELTESQHADPPGDR
jgi:hypothetical protein